MRKVFFFVMGQYKNNGVGNLNGCDCELIEEL